MSEQLKQMAERIKALREVADVSVETLSKDIGISAEALRKYESGNEDIPVSVLISIANRFNIELAVLLTGENPRLHNYLVVRKGKGLNVERRKEYHYQNLAYNFVHKKAEPFLVTVAPESEETPISYNSHVGQEFNYILEGTVKIFINDHELILSEGDSIYFDSGNKHAMRALNGKTAKFLAIIL
ncbi:MAG TPA: helix-turn-helix domain-containing protein [Clostridium sp.]|jgi:transcriptional regulator with XRE-family HTH domain|nr:helix-turn-helix domain-containing protein [Clostridium sp.]